MGRWRREVRHMKSHRVGIAITVKIGLVWNNVPDTQYVVNRRRDPDG